MKRALFLSISVILMFGSGCSSSVWKDSGKVAPISYRPVKNRLNRTVGKLRRLAVLPIRFRYIQGMNVGTGGQAKREAKEARINAENKRRIMFGVLEHLITWKGYEVVPLNTNGELHAKSRNLRPDETRKYVDALAAWADSSPDGAAPPDGIPEMVSRIGSAHNVDGLVVVQGYVKEPSALTFALVLATASVAWPLLFVDGTSEMKADIFEVSTGKIVWRSRFKGTHAGIADARSLFDQLENAVPDVLTHKEQTDQAILEEKGTQ